MAIPVEASASIPVALPACWFCGLHKQANPMACPLNGKACPQKWCAWILRDFWRARQKQHEACLVDEEERDSNSEINILEVDVSLL